jgi:hypothetical protein
VLDLGILLDEKLTFKPHSDMVISKAIGFLGFVKGRAKEIDYDWVTKQIYIPYVRSRLEFGSIIWMPYTSDYIEKIESIQKQLLFFALRHQYNQHEYLRLSLYERRSKIINKLHFQ